MNIGKTVEWIAVRFVYTFLVVYAVAWIGVCILAISLVTASVVGAHEAPTGWRYPFACCADRDCRPVGADRIHETTDGYRVPSGEVVPRDSRRVRNSPDGLYHWCTASGADDTRTLCLFVPPRLF